MYALREEGDITATQTHHGARHTVHISIRALREEGDITNPLDGVSSCTFLSTPSARRATAKTEKNISAFVSL